MANPWFRMHAEFEDDPKVRVLPEVMQLRLVWLMCEHCKGVTLSERHRTFQWRCSEQELAATKAEFIASGFIDEDWNLLNWNKRQYISDSSTERTRRYRERKKSSHDRHKNVTVTPPDTDTDTDTEKKPSRAKREVDARHAPFRKILDGYWHTHNQSEMPWSGGEAKAMAELLAANPAMTEADFRRLLGNRHKSTVNHAERPRAWLAVLTNYGNGPLDRFGKPLETPTRPHRPEPGIYQGDKTDDAWVNEWRAKQGLAPLEVQ